MVPATCGDGHISFPETGLDGFNLLFFIAVDVQLASVISLRYFDCKKTGPTQSVAIRCCGLLFGLPQPLDVILLVASSSRATEHQAQFCT